MGRGQAGEESKGGGERLGRRGMPGEGKGPGRAGQARVGQGWGGVAWTLCDKCKAALALP